MRRLRVAMLGWHPGTQGGRISGGSEAHVVYLAQGLARREDVEVHIITRKASIPAGVLHEDGLTVHCLPKARRQRLIFNQGDVRRLRGLVRSLKPDVVHGHGTAVFADAAISSGLPHVITPHGFLYREGPLEPTLQQRLVLTLDGWYERYNMRRVRHVIVYSSYAAEECKRLAPQARQHPIDNPVDERYFSIVAEPQPGLILCPARLRPLKGILTLLQAFERVSREVPEARLLISGESHVYPQYAAECFAFVRERQLGEQVEFSGWLDSEAMQHEYARASVMVLASRQENAPLSIVEAMAAARPVVATRVGGIPWQVSEGRTGLLVPPYNPEALAQALLQMLKEPARARDLGEEGRREALRRFHPDVVAGKTVALYQGLAGWKP